MINVKQGRPGPRDVGSTLLLQALPPTSGRHLGGQELKKKNKSWLLEKTLGEIPPCSIGLVTELNLRIKEK